ncbi:MAG: hypothetical protein QHH07_07170 [Sedimentisphaerales bacterium]|nr:hypothetical protein [Sedimentisphaerales bacterium]
MAREGGPADPDHLLQMNAKLVAQAWKERVGALPMRQDPNGAAELAALIEKVRSLHIVRHQVAQARPPAAIAEVNAATPNPIIADANAQPNGLDVVVGQLDPNKVVDPLKMAEALNKAGYCRQAIPFYQRALVILDKDDPNAIPWRQWVLLQLGRCLLEEDPRLASPFLNRLIEDYPASQWCPLARTLKSLADWYVAERPLEVIKLIEAATERPDDQAR